LREHARAARVLVGSPALSAPTAPPSRIRRVARECGGRFHPGFAPAGGSSWLLRHRVRKDFMSNYAKALKAKHSNLTIEITNIEGEDWVEIVVRTV